MTMLQLGFLALVFIATVALALWLIQWVGGNATASRLRRVVSGPVATATTSTERWIGRMAHATRPFAKLSAPEEGYETSALRRRFVNAGIRNAASPAAFFGAKTVLAIGLPMLTFAGLTLVQTTVKGNSLLMWLLCAAALGYYLPNLVLSHLVKIRQREIFENFPDALDLMTVCVEAGLGTEAALTRVADDMVHKSAALSDELRLVNLELRAGAPRDRALRNLAIRTGVEEVDGFVSMIIQAERFGTSIAQSLRVHADMLRTRRRQRAEEAAAKIALKLLFPLIFFIFPSLMLVLMGPAMIQIYRVLLPTMAGSGS
ncbi:type II secretion system F family protein [Piscinibacter sp.]|uniref:type II secretion system F family protein n=1 Tax=Piscinibacter sp. TaxID=1903157 RepID=UPI002C20BC07|nr:type II secretion system F family protein [Albitalea sp.]HUG26548.1 type II secretion system F family protein [Albitalea sp.]